MNDTLMMAENVRKIYKSGSKEVRAVNGVSLRIKKGSSSAIVGPSGAGKSTLLHLLGGLDTPTSGAVILGGVEIYELSDQERARIRNRRIGFVFQFYYLLPEFTVLENVMLPALIKGQVSIAKGKGVKDRAMEVLKLVGLSDRTDHKPSELSGGESQRVAIARSLINEPDILLCDEPTGNLDSKTSESIYELLFKVKSKSNTSLVIVTHDERLSEKTEETIRIKDGKIVPQIS